jgi:hypothetical protein
MTPEDTAYKAALTQVARYIYQSKWLERNRMLNDLHRVHQSWIAFCNQLPEDLQTAARAVWWNEFVR